MLPTDIWLQLRLDAECTRPRLWRLYRTAGRNVAVDLDLPALVPFARARGRDATVHRPASQYRPPAPAAAAARPLFDGDVLLGGCVRRVTCRSDSQGTWLTVADGGDWWIAADGAVAERRGPDGATLPGADLLESIALGPVLTLALAAHGTFCLHASAVSRAGRAIAFVGASGAGKSTLAALLAEFDPSWCRLADDILPLTAGVSGADVLRAFPQLKLALDAQPGVDGPERLPLAAVYVLEPRAERVSAETASPREGALAFSAHTVAARLFAPGVLAGHLAFCGALTAEVPVRRLAVPWVKTALPEVSRVLAELEGRA